MSLPPVSALEQLAWATVDTEIASKKIANRIVQYWAEQREKGFSKASIGRYVRSTNPPYGTGGKLVDATVEEVFRQWDIVRHRALNREEIAHANRSDIEWRRHRVYASIFRRPVYEPTCSSRWYIPEGFEGDVNSWRNRRNSADLGDKCNDIVVHDSPDGRFVIAFVNRKGVNETLMVKHPNGRVTAYEIIGITDRSYSVGGIITLFGGGLIQRAIARCIRIEHDFERGCTLVCDGTDEPVLWSDVASDVITWKPEELPYADDGVSFVTKQQANYSGGTRFIAIAI